MPLAVEGVALEFAVQTQLEPELLQVPVVPASGLLNPAASWAQDPTPVDARQLVGMVMSRTSDAVVEDEYIKLVWKVIVPVTLAEAIWMVSPGHEALGIDTPE